MHTIRVSVMTYEDVAKASKVAGKETSNSPYLNYGKSDYADFTFTSASKAAKVYLEFSKRGWAVRLMNW